MLQHTTAINGLKYFSADAYSLFEEIGILSKTAGNKFKKEILSKGGSRTAMESFYCF